jgi:hypothetical protein
MSIFNRLAEDVSVHAFNAALRQMMRGNVTPQTIAARFALLPEDTADLAAIRTKIQASAYTSDDAMDWFELYAHGILSEAEVRTLFQLPPPPG